jgi:hypothetical protein
VSAADDAGLADGGLAGAGEGRLSASRGEGFRGKVIPGPPPPARGRNGGVE